MGVAAPAPVYSPIPEAWSLNRRADARAQHLGTRSPRDQACGRSAQREAHDSAHRGARLPTAGVAATGSLSYVSVLSAMAIDGYNTEFRVAYLRWFGRPTVWMQADVTESAIVEQAPLAVTRAGVMSEAARATCSRAKTERRAEALPPRAHHARSAERPLPRRLVAARVLPAESPEQSRERRIVAERVAIAGARLWPRVSSASGRLLAACRSDERGVVCGRDRAEPGHRLVRPRSKADLPARSPRASGFTPAAPCTSLAPGRR